MSVREYIGARYVPLFADPLEWDATRTYEPLTVVLYQGNSYTSRQAVPANIPITNTTYWAQTGNYNAQIEQYRAEVQALGNTVAANTTAISNEATTRQNEDATLSQSISAEATARENADISLSNAIGELSDDIDELSGKVMLSGYTGIIYGDSTMIENTFQTDRLGTLIAEETGMTIENRAVVGTALAQFNTLLQNASASDFTGRDFVFIAFCTNDWQNGTFLWDNLQGGQSCFHSLLVSCFDRLDAIRGDCRVVFVTPAYGYNANASTVSEHNEDTNKIGATLENYVDVALLECNRRGYAAIDLYHTMGVSVENYRDLFNRSSIDPSEPAYNIYVHYNQKMKERIAKVFLHAFPYVTPADTTNSTVNKLIPSMQYPIIRPASHATGLNSLVPIVATLKKPASGQGIILNKQTLSGRNTLSFYAVGWRGSVSISKDGVLAGKWEVNQSGYYDIYIDGLVGQYTIVFQPGNDYQVTVGNLMLTDGHNMFAQYTAPIGSTGMRKSPSGWSEKGNAADIVTGVMNNFLIVNMQRFTLTSNCAANEEIFITSLENLGTVPFTSFTANVFSNSQWGTIGLTLKQRDTGIGFAANRALSSGDILEGCLVIPLIAQNSETTPTW